MLAAMMAQAPRPLQRQFGGLADGVATMSGMYVDGPAMRGNRISRPLLGADPPQVCDCLPVSAQGRAAWAARAGAGGARACCRRGKHEAGRCPGRSRAGAWRGCCCRSHWCGRQQGGAACGAGRRGPARAQMCGQALKPVTVTSGHAQRRVCVGRCRHVYRSSRQWSVATRRHKGWVAGQGHACLCCGRSTAGRLVGYIIMWSAVLRSRLARCNPPCGALIDWLIALLVVRRARLRPPATPARARSAASRLAAARAGTAIKAWTADEEKLFVEGVALHGRDWDAVAAHIGSRDVPAVRSHAQGYFIKLCRAGKRVPRKVAETGGEGYTMSGKPLDPASATARMHGLTDDRLAGAPRPCAWRAAAARGMPTRAWPAFTRAVACPRTCPCAPAGAVARAASLGGRPWCERARAPWRLAWVEGLPYLTTAARRGPRRGSVTSLLVCLRRAAKAGAARARGARLRCAPRAARRGSSAPVLGRGRP